jgi:hypothetical protein
VKYTVLTAGNRNGTDPVELGAASAGHQQHRSVRELLWPTLGAGGHLEHRACRRLAFILPAGRVLAGQNDMQFTPW